MIVIIIRKHSAFPLKTAPYVSISIRSARRVYCNNRPQTRHLRWYRERMEYAPIVINVLVKNSNNNTRSYSDERAQTPHYRRFRVLQVYIIYTPCTRPLPFIFIPLKESRRVHLMATTASWTRVAAQSAEETGEEHSGRVCRMVWQFMGCSLHLPLLRRWAILQVRPIFLLLSRLSGPVLQTVQRDTASCLPHSPLCFSASVNPYSCLPRSTLWFSVSVNPYSCLPRSTLWFFFSVNPYSCLPRSTLWFSASQLIPTAACLVLPYGSLPLS